MHCSRCGSYGKLSPDVASMRRFNSITQCVNLAVTNDNGLCKSKCVRPRSGVRRTGKRGIDCFARQPFSQGLTCCDFYTGSAIDRHHDPQPGQRDLLYAGAMAMQGKRKKLRKLLDQMAGCCGKIGQIRRKLPGHAIGHGHK